MPERVPGRETEPGETFSSHEGALIKSMNVDTGDSGQVSFGYVDICKPLWRLLRGFLEIGVDFFGTLQLDFRRKQTTCGCVRPRP